jgi:DNA-directed RNA polymerase II subunit RPB2
MTDKCTTDKCTADKCPTDNNKLQEDEFSWTIINSYFDNKHLKQLVKHQIESYNYFINSQLQDTINMFNPLVITSEQFYNRDKRLNTLEVVIKFDNLSIHRPQLHENNGATRLMFPQDARLRNFTYSSNLLIDLDIEYIVREGDNCDNVRKINKRIPNIHIGKIPVMLKSDICILTQYSHLDSTITGECKMDPGGYFIINGSEKTCIAQERAAENQVYCFNVEKNSTKWSWEAQYKAVPDWKYISPKQMSIKISSKNNGFGHPIYLEIPRLKNPIPLFIVFRAYGIISDRAICEKIILDCESQDLKEMLASLKASIVDANNYLTQCEAIKYIIGSVVYTPLSNDRENNIKRKHDFATEVLKNDIFPNAYNETQKVYMIGYMTNMLLKTSFGWIKETDRDNYINKRIDLTGVLLNNLFRNYFNKLVKDMQKQIVKEINNGSWRSSEDYQGIINLTNIYKIVKSTTIENGIKRALSTGDFGIKQINSNKVGVAQVLNRLTYIASLSHLRRINTPIDKSGKLIPPRRLHNSTWGLICPAETPEGAPIGIVKNLSYMTHVTIRAYSKPLYEYIKRLSKPLDECSQNELIRSVKVFVNGLWIAVTDAPIELYDDLDRSDWLE